MKTIEIICKTCGKTTLKPKNEVNRQTKNGRTEFYCNLKCAGKNSKNIKHLTKFHDNFTKVKYTRQSDSLSNFRSYMKNIIKNSKYRNKEYDVDLKYLKDLWESQNGICPFTNKKLLIRTHSNKDKKNPYQASIDRIDNTKGYIKGNIRFVSLMFNYARNNFSDNEVLEFCKNVADNT